jgi:hypothetical protein
LESPSVATLKGKFEIEDITNKMVSRIVITEKPNALLNGVFGMFGKKEKEVEVDLNEISLKIFKRVSADKIVFSTGSGNFARYLQIDKKIYFQHSRIESLSWIPEEHTDKTLPTSSVLRKEIALLKAGQIDDAQQ